MDGKVLTPNTLYYMYCHKLDIYNYDSVGSRPYNRVNELHVIRKLFTEH